MIGGYAQQSYGFNYYGTIGTNRDEFVIVRKMAKVDWLDRPARRISRKPLSHVDRRRVRGRQNENPRANRDGAEPRQVHRVSHLLGHLQERVDQPRGHGIRLVQQRRDQARHRLSQGLGEPGALERRLAAQEQRQDRAQDRRQVARARQHLRQPRPARDRRLLRALHLRLRAPAEGARAAGVPDRAPALAHHRRAHGEDRVGPELGGDPGRRVRQALGRRTTSRACRRRSTASSRTPS